MTHDETIAVIQAHMEGKTIERRPRRAIADDDTWKIDRDPTWDFSVFEYRVKPEPAVIYAVLGGLTGRVVCASVELSAIRDYPRARRFIEDTNWKPE